MIFELLVRNHPGTLSHIAGLFARRAFNLESVLCTPIGDGTQSVMLLLVADSPQMAQVERQLEKLHDVISIRPRPDCTVDLFRSASFGSACATTPPTLNINAP